MPRACVTIVTAGTLYLSTLASRNQRDTRTSPPHLNLPSLDCTWFCGLPYLADSAEPMAPDLNSLSRSPRSERPQPQRTSSNPALSGASSRRTSQVMGPPAAPASHMSSNGGTERVPMSHRLSSSHEHDGPLRHPRPLTAAELYAECEKEQEAVVCPFGTMLSRKHGLRLY